MYLQLAERGKVNVSSYKRKRTVVAHKRRYPLSEEAGKDSPDNPYIFVPDFESGQGGIYVREDKFDGLPKDQYKLFMDLLAPYQPEHAHALSEGDEQFLAGIFKNWIAHREERKEKREARKQQRQDRRSKRADSKSRARETRAQAKLNKSNSGDESVLDKIIGGAKEIIGGAQGGDSGATDDTPFYKKPVFMVGGVLLVAGGIYMATKKK